jgi:ubiquinone/menaquinone biosynthesis C-methylase UbiE
MVPSSSEKWMLTYEVYLMQAKKWEKRLEERYNKVADDFGCTPKKTGSVKLRNDLRKKTYELLEYDINNNILEVVIGNGLMFNNLKYKDINYIGLDLSIRMLENATRRADESAIPFSPVHGNAVELPFKKGSFDNTICIDMLHHVPAELLNNVINELIRVTNINGQILLEIKNSFNFLIKHNYKRTQKNGPLIMHPINPISFRNYLRSKGLSVTIYFIGPFYLFAPFVLFSIHPSRGINNESNLLYPSGCVTQTSRKCL